MELQSMKVEVTTGDMGIAAGFQAKSELSY